MTKVNKALVIAESAVQARELLAGASELAESTTFFCAEAVDVMAGSIRLELDAGVAFVEAIPSIVSYAKENAFDIVLLGSTQNCRLLAGCLSVAFGTSTLCDAQGLEIVDGALQSTRLVYGGAAIRTEKAAIPTAVAIVANAAFEACADASQPSRESLAVIPSGVKVSGVEEKQVESVDLASAKTLICVGRGFGAEEELQLAEAFAAKVGAEIGCTRPISEGEGWMSSARYVGVSGLMLKPDVYFGLGVSGQVQHMVGVNPARVIVAINTDPNAPIFKQCDYGLVASVQEALPLLTEKL